MVVVDVFSQAPAKGQRSPYIQYLSGNASRKQKYEIDGGYISAIETHYVRSRILFI